MLTVKTYFWFCQALMTSYGLLSPLYAPATLNIVIYQCWEKDERNGRALYFFIPCVCAGRFTELSAFSEQKNFLPVRDWSHAIILLLT